MGAGLPIRTPKPGPPAWLLFSVLTIFLWGAWGVQSKVIVDRLSPWMNQVLFPLGLAPVALCVLFSRNLGKSVNRRKGAGYALLTGVLGGTGNILFFLSFASGGRASIVVPITCLFPLVTVLLAAWVLRESITRPQRAGLILAVVAIYLLSV